MSLCGPAPGLASRPPTCRPARARVPDVQMRFCRSTDFLRRIPAGPFGLVQARDRKGNHTARAVPAEYETHPILSTEGVNEFAIGSQWSQNPQPWNDPRGFQPGASPRRYWHRCNERACQSVHSGCRAPASAKGFRKGVSVADCRGCTDGPVLAGGEGVGAVRWLPRQGWPSCGPARARCFAESPLNAQSARQPPVRCFC